MLHQPVPPDDLSRPPVPVPGCGTCTELAIRRDDARARCNRSAETDANVLLRHHLRRDHASRTAYTIVQDPSTKPHYESHCVSGTGTACGASSGPHHDRAQIEDWQHTHTHQTQHTRYRRTFADYAVMEPL
ncbi:hypothetical protein [Streptomyces yerevanensis]|uniref:DUF7848 domain-containing protein n=1 Tax=Streptomyces yerevanensis TaxID=66378 RepID=UPI0007C54E29